MLGKQYRPSSDVALCGSGSTLFAHPVFANTVHAARVCVGYSVYKGCNQASADNKQYLDKQASPAKSIVLNAGNV